MPTAGHRWARRNPILAGFLGLFIWTTLVGYVEDVQSCRRTRGTRLAQSTNRALIAKALVQEADRARNYAKVDHNPRGVTINEKFATKRYRIAAALRVPDVPDCFPIPGV